MHRDRPCAGLGRGAGFDENDNITINPERYWDATLPADCQPKRSYRVYRKGLTETPDEIGPLSVVEGVNTMTVGETRTSTMVFQAGAAGGAFRFIEDAARGTNAVSVTRLPDIRDELDRPVRQWRVASQGSHKAGDLGTLATYYLPFVMTVTEVPYPYPTYP